MYRIHKKEFYLLSSVVIAVPQLAVFVVVVAVVVVVDHGLALARLAAAAAVALVNVQVGLGQMLKILEALLVVGL